MKRNIVGEKILEKIIFIGGISGIFILFLIFAFLLKESLGFFFRYPLKDFFLGTNWYPTNSPPKFGLIPLLLGSLFVTLGAISISFPLGVACAIYISEVAPSWAREFLKPLMELIAAIPSVVLGFIGLVVLVPFIKEIFNLPTGLTALAGSITLAFMALPTITSIAEDAISALPKEYKEASFALGATHWQTIRNVLLPAAKPGILAATMLGLGRAIGETMAVLMVTGNAAVIPHTFLQPVRTMTATIAMEMGEVVKGGLHYTALFAIGLVLFVITFAVNFVADWVINKQKR
ncbi:MAG: phosphate ABC transporter permease subunit PstC [bacterium]